MIDSEIEPQPGEGKRINTINLKGPVPAKGGVLHWRRTSRSRP